jgi:hypothetical protein
MWLSSQTHLKPHEKFSIPNYNFYRLDRHPGIKGGTVVEVRKGVPHNHVDLPPLMSIEATRVCILIGNSEILLAAIYKSAGRAWSDANFPVLLNIRNKCILAGDMNAKEKIWNSAVSNPSGKELLKLFDLDDFEF